MSNVGRISSLESYNSFPTCFLKFFSSLDWRFSVFSYQAFFWSFYVVNFSAYQNVFHCYCSCNPWMFCVFFFFFFFLFHPVFFFLFVIYNSFLVFFLFKKKKKKKPEREF